MHVGIKHAWDVTEKRRVWAVDPRVEKAEKGRYQCTACARPVHVRRGEQNVPHFAHYAQSACARYAVSGQVSESELHCEAKYLLADYLQTCVSQLDNVEYRSEQKGWLVLQQTCGRCYRTCEMTWPSISTLSLVQSRVMVEWKTHDYCADVAVVHQDDTPAVIFEILHTHVTERQRPEPWFELNAAAVCERLLQWQQDQRPALSMPFINQRQQNGMISCEIGGAQCQTMLELARQLGYCRRVRESGRSLMDWLIQTCRGKRRIYWNWTLTPVSNTQHANVHWLWNEWQRRQRCLRCSQPYPSDSPLAAAQKSPYCSRCQSRIRVIQVTHDPQAHFQLKEGVEDEPLPVEDLKRRRQWCRSLLTVAKWKPSCSSTQVGCRCVDCGTSLRLRRDAVFYYGLRSLCRDCLPDRVIPLMYRIAPRHIYMRILIADREEASLIPINTPSSNTSLYFTGTDSQAAVEPAGFARLRNRRRLRTGHPETRS